MSSGDGSNRSNRPPGSPRQPYRRDTTPRQRQTWDVDPAEIDRYLSGRPSRSDEAAGRGADSSTANQLSRLQNAVGRRGAPPPDDTSQATYQGRSARTPEPRYQPAPQAPRYEDDQGYEGHDDDVEEPWETPAQTYTDEIYAEDEVWEEPAPPAQPRRQVARHRPAARPAQQPRQAQRQPRRYEPEPLDAYDDEEFYNDDPYLSYEDDEIDRRPKRAARPRPQVKVSKPNLPKVTIPKSVTDSPLLHDMPSLIMIGISILSIAIMSFLVSDRIGLLGDSIPTHVSASGDPENIRTSDAVWNIPLLAGMVMLMNIAASWFISRIDQFASRFLLAGGLLVHFVAWVALIKYLWE